MKRNAMLMAAGLTSVMMVTACGAPAEIDEDFPEGTIEVIIGFAAGGSTDVNTRALVTAAEETCGTDIVVSNEPGGSGAIALDRVRNAQPDGYTLATTPTELSVLEHMGLSDVTHEDLSSVLRFVLDPHGFFAGPDSSFETIQDVIDAAEDGETIRVGTSGPASPYAITFEDVALQAGVSGQLVNVPFDGDAAAIPAAMSGEVDLIVSNASNVVSHVESGDLRPLVLSADERIDAMPDLPTLAEEGIDVSAGSIYGLAAPADTPQEVMDTLDGCFAEAFETEEFQTFLEDQDINPSYLSGAEYDEYLAAEYERHEELLNELNLADG